MCCLNCKNEKFFFNDETYNCLLPPNQNEENDLILKQNYNFYIFLIIFIISILLSFIIFITCLFYKKENNKNDNKDDNDNDIKKIEIEFKNSIN
jgi:heme/copper-type cytochrome/quinol oxidase subunit 2